MSTRDGMSQEEIAACEADQAEAEFYRDDDDPSCGKCGVKQSNHWLSNQLHKFAPTTGIEGGEKG